jgi:hypothetical protein
MAEDRKQPGIAFSATVTLVTILVGYPLSFAALVALDIYVMKLPEFLHPSLQFVYAPCIWLLRRLMRH